MRKLKARLSEYLRQVKAGRSIIITKRGEVVARLVPHAQSLEEKLLAMVKSGRAEWNGSRLKRSKPVASAKEGHSVAALLVEDRHADFRILYYQDTQDISDWQRTPADRLKTKGRIVRMLARKR